ncbi:MAG: hypothetical protein QGI24_05860 [Kiritimatiellia bacterium]|jgi:hypothetical protein|nr:hypothetical protein [Kiritimatiellia bacterium]MDP6848295.1 hypothetical protein [Kiritimatiellia bacterium]
MSYWVVIYRFAWTLLVVLLLIGVLCIFIPKCNSLHELQRRRTEKEEENALLKHQTVEFIEKQARFETDPEFVERTAHDSGRVKTNETVFKFPEDE